MINSRSFILLCLVAFCCFVSYDMVRRPALALFAESMGAGPGMVGFLLALSTFTGVFLKLPMGLLSDVINRRKLMIGGVLAFALPPFVYPWIDNFTTLGILRVIHGLATAMFTPLALATVGEWIADRRGEAFGWYTSAAQGGGFLGPMLGGITVYAIGYAPTFLVAGIFGLLGLLFFFLIPPGRAPFSPPHPPLGEIWRDIREGWRKVRTIPPIIMASLVEAAKMMGNGTLMAFLPLYGLTIGLNAAEIGMLFGAQALTSFVSKPVMGRVSDRGSRQPLILGGLCLCGVMVMIIPQLEVYPVLLVVAGLFGFGEAVVTSSTTALVADCSEGKGLGAGMGLRGTIMDIGHAGGPLLAGILIEILGYAGGLFCIGMALLITALYFAITMLRLKKSAVL